MERPPSYKEVAGLRRLLRRKSIGRVSQIIASPGGCLTCQLTGLPARSQKENKPQTSDLERPHP